MPKLNSPFLSVVLAGLYLTAPTAHATPIDLDFDVAGNGGNVIWEGIDGERASSDFNLSSDLTGRTALAVDDADTATRGDAFDDALSVAVNGLLVNDDDGIVNIESGVIDTPSFSAPLVSAETATAGSNVVADPVLPDGFSGEFEYFFFESDPVVRLFFSITNIGASAATAAIEIATDLGSDGEHILETESSGNGSFGSEDAFAIFSDEINEDPELLFTFFGDGASALPSTTGLFDNDDVNSLFDLTLDAGETQSLLLFAGVFEPSATSIVDASRLGDTLTSDIDALGASGFLAGLSDQQIATIANYGGLEVNDVPAPSVFALLLIAVGALVRKTR